METLSNYSIVILGRDADAYLTDKGVENLRLLDFAERRLLDVRPRRAGQ